MHQPEYTPYSVLGVPENLTLQIEHLRLELPLNANERLDFGPLKQFYRECERQEDVLHAAGNARHPENRRLFILLDSGVLLLGQRSDKILIQLERVDKEESEDLDHVGEGPHKERHELKQDQSIDDFVVQVDGTDLGHEGEQSKQTNCDFEALGERV